MKFVSVLRDYDVPTHTRTKSWGYVSVSVAVPIPVLLAALSSMLVMSWMGKEQPELGAQASL